MYFHYPQNPLSSACWPVPSPQPLATNALYIISLVLHFWECLIFGIRGSGMIPLSMSSCCWCGAVSRPLVMLPIHSRFSKVSLSLGPGLCADLLSEVLLQWKTTRIKRDASLFALVCFRSSTGMPGFPYFSTLLVRLSSPNVLLTDLLQL